MAPVGGKTFVPREEIILSESFVSRVSSMSDAPSSLAASGDSTKTSSPTTARDVGLHVVGVRTELRELERLVLADRPGLRPLPEVADDRVGVVGRRRPLS